MCVRVCGSAAAVVLIVVLRVDAQTAQNEKFPFWRHCSHWETLPSACTWQCHICVSLPSGLPHSMGKVYGFGIIMVSNTKNIRPRAQRSATAAAAAVTSRALRAQAKI